MKPEFALLPLIIILWIINKLGQLLTAAVLIFYRLSKKIVSEVLLAFQTTYKLLKNLTDHQRPSKRDKKSFINLLTLLKNIKLPKPKFSLRSQKPKVAKTHSLKIQKQKELKKEEIFKRSRKKRTLLQKIFPTPLRIGVSLTVILLAAFFYSITLINLAKELPSPEKLAHTGNPLTTEFYDRKGKLLYRLYEGKNRTLVKLEELPDHLKKATIAIEDQNFYNHSGVDFLGIARAVNAYIERKEVQGGSTITQQLIKNTLLTPERTFERKLKEVALAFWAERIFAKDQILQMYFNEVPYGGPAWGIYAASQTYFNKHPKDLNLAEASFLAGLPASPTTYSPYGTNPKLGKQRQKEVLRRMVEDGYITQKAADQAYSEELAISPPKNPIKAPHFVMYTRELLAKKYGERTVSQGGLKITTTLDLDIQNYSEEVVEEEVAKSVHLNFTNGAAMVVDAQTGHILAMVGSKNYFDGKDGNFNVTTALRQPGSSIKPVTYAAGFKQGYTPGTILLDTPTAFKNAWETYAPVNYDGAFHGPVTIRTALGSSYNIPAVKMLALVGIENMIQTASDLGITTFNDPSRYGLSLTLGGGEVKMVDMMSVYTTFSQNGVKYDIQPVLKLTDANGIVLEDNTYPKGHRVLPSGVAYMINDILSDNKARTPAFGPASLLNIPGKTVAVKTGTTDNKKDNWTFGYTPEYVVGVWVGNSDNTPMNPNLSSGVTGAAPIWNKIITSLVADRPNLAFERPVEIAFSGGDLIISGQPTKSVVGQARKKIKDEKTQEEKEAITFTDPFSTFSTDNLQPLKVVPQP